MSKADVLNRILLKRFSTPKTIFNTSVNSRRNTQVDQFIKLINRCKKHEMMDMS